MVKTLEEVEKAVEQLPQEQLRQFREWYEKCDSEAWDHQIEKESSSGKLDVLAQAAFADHKAGKSKKV